MTAFFRRPLDDDALDALLQAADVELPAYARAATDPGDTIRALHDLAYPEPRPNASPGDAP
ncbi:hypothetical protein OG948_36010 (plasmid) [Embleya sp. NBC_00888]|uniref:hypothetical protein n=1 Tax=Embleya sp. NBC_00888 TaxID=2975960 RepID=UPI002F910D9B|nr:hypothetical protein OG948_36010 [Embleya sp. NBC_00888]